jgi:hypothetical protein
MVHVSARRLRRRGWRSPRSAPPRGLRAARAASGGRRGHTFGVPITTPPARKTLLVARLLWRSVPCPGDPLEATGGFERPVAAAFFGRRGAAGRGGKPQAGARLRPGHGEGGVVDGSTLVATRHNPQISSSSTRGSYSGRQAQEGGSGGLYAQAGDHPQRGDAKEPYPLEVASDPSLLTLETVASSCPIHPPSGKRNSTKYLSRGAS